jgi:hypothetical protein
MLGKAKTVRLSDRQRAVLETVVAAQSTAQQLAERCRIILLSAEGRRKPREPKTRI